MRFSEDRFDRDRAVDHAVGIGTEVTKKLIEQVASAGRAVDPWRGEDKSRPLCP
jgi:hypothetical protein